MSLAQRADKAGVSAVWCPLAMAIRREALWNGDRELRRTARRFGDEFRTLRLRAGVTQAAVARAIGVDRSVICRLEGGDPGVCELRKMYFLPEARGIGAGAAMMDRCLAAAREIGFRRCYLETLTGMDAAMRLYERSGFRRIPGAMGATGHGGCNTFYLLDL